MPNPKNASSPESPAPFLPDVVRHPRAGVVLGFASSALLAYLGLQYHVVGDYGIETDFFWDFVPSARAFLEGVMRIEDFRGPAYPVVLGIANLLVGNFFKTGVILAAFMAGFGVYFTHGLLKKLLSADMAFLGTLLVAVNSVFVQYSYSAGTDMMFFALVAGSAFLFFTPQRRTLLVIAGSAALAAFAYLTRYNGIFAAPAIPLILLTLDPDQEPMKQRAIKSGVFLAAFMVVIAPWGFYCFAEKGSFFYNRNYLNIAYEMFARGSMTWDQYWSEAAERYTSLGQVVFADFGLFISTVTRNFVDHFVRDMGTLTGWHVGIMTVAGTLLAVKQRANRELMGFLLFSFLFFALLLLVFYGERFSMLLLIPYTLLALLALSANNLRSIRFGRNLPLGGLLAVVLVVWTFVKSYDFNRQNIDSGPKEILVIADWFKRNISQGATQDTVLARKPHVAYYLGMTMGGFPYVDSVEELLATARKSHARYLYFSLIEAAMRPQFQFLLDPARAPASLRPLVYTNAPPAVLYEIQQDSATP